MGILHTSHCVFPTPDINKTAEYYKKVLGFSRVDYLSANEPHICLYRDGVELILTDSKGRKVVPNRELYGYGYDAYFIAEGQDALQSEFLNNGATIIRKLCTTDYDNREFVLHDIDGRWIGFGMKKS